MSHTLSETKRLRRPKRKQLQVRISARGTRVEPHLEVVDPDVVLHVCAPAADGDVARLAVHRHGVAVAQVSLPVPQHLENIIAACNRESVHGRTTGPQYVFLSRLAQLSAVLNQLFPTW